MAATALVVSEVKLDEEQITKLIHEAKQLALLHGVQMRPQCDPGCTCMVEYAPMTLFPSAMMVTVVQQAKDLQRQFNTLMFKVAHDHDFMEQALCNVVKVDDFSKRLWHIYTSVREEGVTQPVSLGLFRNDFMLDVKGSCCDIAGLPAKVELKQIEFNTIASSFAGLSSAMWNVHRYIMAKAGAKFSPEQMPENLPSKGLANGLLKAWEHYNNKRAAVVFIVQKCERNTSDQRWIERQLFTLNKNVPVRYLTLKDGCTQCSLTDDKKLLLNGTEVAVVYYRDGYSPEHYASDKEWDLRLLIERSKAIKCPSVGVQLAGCKKIQQELAIPGALERFIKDVDMCAAIRNTFADQFSLDLGSLGDQHIKMALNRPNDFVVKPQREGGGNNVYGEDIVPFLEKIKDSEERNAYILMQRIFPWPQKNILLKEGRDTILRDVITELGIYGVYLGDQNSELHNDEAGHLLRTKSNDDNEGGIMAGFATIDSPLLVEPPCI